MPAHWTLIGGALLVLASEPGPLAEERATVPRDRALAVGTGCGGDAYSFAEVLPPRGARGPVQVVPDTLCADIEDRRRPAIGSLNVAIEPPGRRGVEGRRDPLQSEPRAAHPLDLRPRGRP